jgi:hypothetical protein
VGEDRLDEDARKSPQAGQRGDEEDLERVQTASVRQKRRPRIR